MSDDRNPQQPSRQAITDVAALHREVESLQRALAERDREMQSLRERFEHDLEQARRELAQARVEQERLTEQLHAPGGGADATESSTANPPGNATQYRRPWRARLSRHARRMQRETAQIRQSELFDPEWYLAEYPDVANTGIDPAEHYLLHGGFEGRNPGPEFDSDRYLFDHPDLADSGINPLLHYLRSGPAPRQR